MKKRIITLFTISAIAVSVIACKSKTKEDNIAQVETVAKASEASEKYTADVTASSITWTGYKPTGSHTGTVKLKQGALTLKNGHIESGKFSIDMASIKDSESNARLEKHLKSADFFDVENHPNATFEITEVSKNEGETMISGNLTVKNITNKVAFPVSITNNNNSVTLTSDTFKIDRSKWEIKFKSKSFFTNLGDKFINDDIDLKISVTATK
ncbi:YceI family protein [Snuella sedimenti]|uniref:YceI family protein n=1 Tax=Snuella sedimenti TaxID=2798802 RepID=A0A8J7LM42_9FLAO|nr:YceI family protein [Snuella sedimenti]MBJ6367059.1 YceI family protein [Snuella sedimenti]